MQCRCFEKKSVLWLQNCLKTYSHFLLKTSHISFLSLFLWLLCILKWWISFSFFFFLEETSLLSHTFIKSTPVYSRKVKYAGSCVLRRMEMLSMTRPSTSTGDMNAPVFTYGFKTGMLMPSILRYSVKLPFNRWKCTPRLLSTSSRQGKEICCVVFPKGHLLRSVLWHFFPCYFYWYIYLSTNWLFWS